MRHLRLCACRVVFFSMRRFSDVPYARGNAVKPPFLFLWMIDDAVLFVMLNMNSECEYEHIGAQFGALDGCRRLRIVRRRMVRVMVMPDIDIDIAPETVPDIHTDADALHRTLTERLPPYAVVLYNDDYHAMDYVVVALVKSVPQLTVEEAAGIMLEAHNTGSAVVVVCVLEQAELYRDRIQSYGLGVSIRRA